MKHTYTSLCTAALLMLAACTNDPAEDLLSSNDTRPDALPEGTFVVDYLPSADLPATRVLGDDEVILSLDYLLYASTGDSPYTLTKHKKISDISADTHWPLTRENMTWTQRQELKDTLSTDSKYKVVFVANADKDKVWPNRKWADNKEFQPMTHVDVKTVTEDGTETGSTFDQARLLLPPNGDFQQTDGIYTFYYMWTGEIDPATNGYDKNTPAQMQVELQRMVNKIEIRLEEQVVNALKEATNVEDYVVEELNEYYQTNYVINTEGTMSGTLYNVVNEYLEGIAQKIGIKEEPGGWATNEQKSKYTFQELLKASGSKGKVVNSISGISPTVCTTAETSCCVWHQFINECKEYFIIRCDWSNLTSVSVNYTQQAFPYAIDFNMNTKAEAGQSYTITAPKETTENSYDNRYVFYTFSNKGGTENLNNISTITFYNNNNEAFTVASSITPGNSPTEGNNHYFLTYQPITGKAVSESQTFTFQRDQYNMQSVIGWNWNDDVWDWGAIGWQSDDMTGWVNGLFSGNEDENSSFVPYTLELTIPKVEITTPWSTEEYTPQQQNNN